MKYYLPNFSIFQIVRSISPATVGDIGSERGPAAGIQECRLNDERIKNSFNDYLQELPDLGHGQTGPDPGQQTGPEGEGGQTAGGH